MSRKSIIYGKIINDRDREKIEKSHPGQTENIQWLNSPQMAAHPGTEALVLVDLDDPSFANPDFLVSIATAGQNVKIVGKADNPSQSEILQAAKMGVSEILNSEQCLKRLHEFLEELEDLGVKKEAPKSKLETEALIGKSTAIKSIRKTLELLADVDYPSVLILGETGTGKGLIAKILHSSGCRAKYNLVEVNCSAIPDDLFESELFGHTKGAFTDAKQEKTGLFEYAQNGTIFFDEVGNLTLSAQAKLLKIVEDKKLRKVGSVEEKDINVRVIAATNSDLQKTIADGRFREDLFFRLNLLTIDIPPLRKRIEDIPEITAHYLAHFSKLYGKEGLTIEEDAVARMQEYQWPGNVRELCNVIERAVLLNRADELKESEIRDVLDKKKNAKRSTESLIFEIPTTGQSLKEIEQVIIRTVLAKFDGNKSETAKFLGISRPRLRRIISGHSDADDRD
ncbi:MAG TPA: sigma-54 dependent transcriptional regulator [candidate division Zixibacteria bacterium]|nr:sigma-54 dependent transcriptional regulator [candidate division Zixibacteria bacterium]